MIDALDTLGPDEYVPSCPTHGRERIVRCGQSGRLHCACGWRPKHPLASPADLAGALEDRVHLDVGRVRVPHVARYSTPNRENPA